VVQIICFFSYSYRSGSSDLLPAEDNGSLLDFTELKLTTDDHSNWFDGLSKHVRLAVFVSPLLELKTTIFSCTMNTILFIF